MTQTEQPTVVFKDETLTHQLDLVWSSRSKRETTPVCNCGWTGTRRRPEAFGAIQATVAEYEGHLVSSR